VMGQVSIKPGGAGWTVFGKLFNIYLKFFCKMFIKNRKKMTDQASTL
jgi:hypothetical protein